LSLNLTYGESQQFDFGLPEGQKLEFWWDMYLGTGRSQFEIRHLTDDLWGWWWGWHNLEVQEPYRSRLEKTYWTNSLGKEDVITNLFDEDYNATYCEFACDHLKIKIFILTYNQSWTLEESWDNEKLKIYTSYDIDWSKTGTSMWGVMTQLLTFQNPNLGIPGVFGTILTIGFGGALWACIAVLFFALITSVIPTISGWRGD